MAEQDTQAIIETAQAAVELKAVGDDGRLFAAVVPEGYEIKHVDVQELLAESGAACFPHRKKGTVQANDSASFVAYVNRHTVPGTEMWADQENQTVTAVIDSDEPSVDDTFGIPGWGQHRAVLKLGLTPAWQAWTGKDRQWLTQDKMAELIEDRDVDVVSHQGSPSAADMVELAESFKANVKVAFGSSKRTATGETSIEYSEQIDAKAGRRGQLAIPDFFYVLLTPFVGQELLPVEKRQAWKIKCRFRYRINNQQLTLSYAMERPEEVLTAAFAKVVEEIRGGIEPDVWMGAPVDGHLSTRG